MVCKKAQSLIQGYIDETLSDYELTQFLEHIDSCPECYDELEIYYTVLTGIQRLDDDSASFDLRNTMRNSIAESKTYIKQLDILKRIRYASMTLAGYGILVALFIQFRIWFF